MSERTIIDKFIYFPLTRIIFGLLVCGVVIFLGATVFEWVLGLTPAPALARDLLIGALTALLAVVVYIQLFQRYEKREITEFSWRNGRRYLLPGLALGALLQGLTILVIYLFGDYSVISVNAPWMLLVQLGLAINAAILEEIIFRGIIFRILEERLGTYLALGVSAALFGGAHLFSPNSSIMIAIALSVQAGVLLAVAYILTRNLWFPIAIHLAWNFTQAGIFGADVSGADTSQSLISAQINGPQWLTGGAFGPEGSIQATLFCLVAAGVLFWLSLKGDKLIPRPAKNRSGASNENNTSKGFLRRG